MEAKEVVVVRLHRVRVGDRDGHVDEIHNESARVTFDWGQPHVQWHKLSEIHPYIVSPKSLAEEDVLQKLGIGPSLGTP